MYSMAVTSWKSHKMAEMTDTAFILFTVYATVSTAIGMLQILLSEQWDIRSLYIN